MQPVVGHLTCFGPFGSPTVVELLKYSAKCSLLKVWLQVLVMGSSKYRSDNGHLRFTVACDMIGVSDPEPESELLPVWLVLPL